MSALLRAGSKPVLSSCAFIALTSLSGCASNGAHSYTAQNTAVTPRIAQAAAAMEDDGLPVQAPPPRRIRQMPDEPAEPFSKNYGGGNPAALGVGTASPPDKVPLHQPPVPDEQAPQQRQKLTAAFNADE